MEVEAKLNKGMEDCLSAFCQETTNYFKCPCSNRHRINPDASHRGEGGESRDVACRERGQAKPEAHSSCSSSSNTERQ